MVWCLQGWLILLAASLALSLASELPLHTCSDMHFGVCLQGLGTCLLHFCTVEWIEQRKLSLSDGSTHCCRGSLAQVQGQHQAASSVHPQPLHPAADFISYFCPTQKPLGLPTVIHAPLLHPGCSPNRSSSLFFYSCIALSWEHHCLPTFKPLCPC